MAKDNPTVITGMRTEANTAAAPPNPSTPPRIPPSLRANGPRDIKSETPPEGDPGAAARLTGRVVYNSKYPNLRVTLTQPSEEHDSTNKRWVTIAGISAQFRGGVFATQDTKIIELLEKSGNFGLNKDFWRADEMQTAADNARRAEIMKALKEDPALREQVAEFVTGNEFDLPGVVEGSSADKQ